MVQWLVYSKLDVYSADVKKEREDLSLFSTPSPHPHKTANFYLGQNDNVAQ